METVVTIDFDIIFYPMIELYNNMSGDKWEERLNRHTLLRSPVLDYTCYTHLTEYILKCMKTVPAEQVYFIEKHEKAVNHLPVFAPFNLINIDHHHDYAYSDEDVNRKITQQLLNCGNWVKYAVDNKYRVESYTWINDANSRMSDAMEKHPLLQGKCTIKEIKEIDFKDFPTADRLILCLSPEWAHPECYSLFFTWLEIAKAFYDQDYTLEE